jgi:thiamine biosynthesis lipoprotein
LVTIQILLNHDVEPSQRVMQQAFDLMAHIATVMSAHDPRSDLGRMSRAQSGEVLKLDPHTVKVIQASQYWREKSAGAFNPACAGDRLARQGVRPGLCGRQQGECDIRELHVLSDREVQMPSPLSLDFGGIAKGYAVDQAANWLLQHGVDVALINAGGDLRVVGERPWPVDIVHTRGSLRDVSFNRPMRMGQGALATSSTLKLETDFVQTLARQRRLWRSATVRARDCMTADALTKWALQSSRLCPVLKLALREHRAQMWRS